MNGEARPAARVETYPPRGGRYVISVASLAIYREPTMRRLASTLGDELSIFAGHPAYDASISLISPDSGVYTPVRNHYFGHDILVQRLPWKRLLRAPVLLMDWNPRIPHVWLMLLARKITKRPTLLWGHAWPRDGVKTSMSARIRQRMASLATGVVTYTRGQAREVQQRHPKLQVTAAPNALYSRKMFSFDQGRERSAIVYVGRLDSAKKPLLLLEAFERHAAAVGETTLEIVGDGPLRSTIHDRVSNSAYASRITLHGQITEYERLRAIFASALFSVSSGYAGLALTHSLGFGVPVVISRHEPHAPEIEAAIEGWNAVYFDTDNSMSLALTMDTLARGGGGLAHGTEIAARCADQFSVEAMTDGLHHALVKARTK